MADNIILNVGSGGAIIAADDVSSVWYQINKLAFGALNSVAVVSSADPLPIALPQSLALAEGGALGRGFLMQGDQGGSRHNLIVTTSGHMNVAVTSGNLPGDVFAAEAGALGKGVLLQGDDGTDRHNLQTSTSGHLLVHVRSGQLQITSGTVDVRSLVNMNPANHSVAAADRVDAMYLGSLAVTPARAAVNGATSGNNTMVAAQTGRVRMHEVFLMAAGTVTLRLIDGSGGTALVGSVTLLPAVGFVLPYSKMGWGQTSSNTALIMHLSAAVHVGGVVGYSTP